MKEKVLNLLLLLTSLFGYLEWGGGNHSFLFQAEGEVLSTLATNPREAAHPFILLPLAGQLLLFVTLFQRRPTRWLTFGGMAGVGVLLAFMFVVGLLGLNLKVLLSTLPFLITAFVTLRHWRMVRAKDQPKS